jgi:hypothetical protein
MLAANYNITLDRGADYSFVLTLNSPAGTPVVITGAGFDSDVRDVKTKAQAGVLSGVVTTGASGIATFSMIAADTKLLRAGTGLYEYDIFMTLGGVKRRLLYGSFTLRPQSTNQV